MKKSKWKKNFLFVLIILAFALLVIGFYYIVIEHKNPFAEFIKVIKNEDGILDNFNGIYTYVDELGDTYSVFQGCAVNKIQNYILIHNDKYTLYRSSCMGTYYKGDGKTADLKISETEDKKTYVVNYDGKNYVKDLLTNKIVPNNAIKSSTRLINLTSLQLLVDETEFEGNEYNINNAKLRNNMKLAFSLDINSRYLMIEATVGKNKYMVYSYNIRDLKKLPLFYEYASNLAVIERDDNIYDSNKFAYILSYITESGKIYDLRDYFPISVDNVSLSYENNSIFVKFDPSSRDYILLIGNDKNMCDEKNEESDKDEIAYYEFTIDYNYLSGGFERPVFKRIGYKSEGCKYVNSIIGGAK